MTELEAARAELEQKARTLNPAMFSYAVWFVTKDHSSFFESAYAERFGNFYLIWTEHHGDFLEHKDEVLHCRMFEFVPMTETKANAV